MAVIRYMILCNFFEYIGDRTAADEAKILPPIREVIHSFGK
jgi:hypothetical protein